jgi:hypothetical protein
MLACAEIEYYCENCAPGDVRAIRLISPRNLRFHEIFNFI